MIYTYKKYNRTQSRKAISFKVTETGWKQIEHLFTYSINKNTFVGNVLGISNGIKVNGFWNWRLHSNCYEVTSNGAQTKIYNIYGTCGDNTCGNAPQYYLLKHNLVKPANELFNGIKVILDKHQELLTFMESIIF